MPTMTAEETLLRAVEQLAPDVHERFVELAKFLEDKLERERCARIAGELAIYLQYGDVPAGHR